jgi:predicted permease
MSDVAVKLLPIFVGFAVAFALKRFGVVQTKHGHLLLKIALFTTIPALIFVSVSKIALTHSLILFPLLSAIILAITYPIVRFLSNRMRQPKATEGTFRVAPMTINSGFVLTFMLSVFGGEGATRVILFNAGFNPLLLIGVYGLAASYNDENKRRRDVLKRILILPPLWALLAGLAVNLSGGHIPEAAADALQAFGGLSTVLMVAALGILFTPRRVHFDKTLAIVGLRMGLGLLIGLGLVAALGLEGMDRAAVLALCAAPVGFNLLTFASAEKLDHELAANAVSLSLVFGLILVPLILLFTT